MDERILELENENVKEMPDIEEMGELRHDVETLHVELLKNHRIDPNLYAKYDVKRGLRDSTGKGVLTGLTEINDLKDLTDDNRKNVFIIDDSLFNRTSCKKTELASKVFDHTDMHFKKGFRMLTLSWSDGNTLIPVNSCLLASAKDTRFLVFQPSTDHSHPFKRYGCDCYD